MGQEVGVERVGQVEKGWVVGEEGGEEWRGGEGGRGVGVRPGEWGGRK